MMDTNKLKAEIIRQLKYLSEWTDNGECREYNDIDKKRATEIADEIIKESEGKKQPDTESKCNKHIVNGRCAKCTHQNNREMCDACIGGNLFKSTYR